MQRAYDLSGERRSPIAARLHKAEPIASFSHWEAGHLLVR